MKNIKPMLYKNLLPYHPQSYRNLNNKFLMVFTLTSHGSTAYITTLLTVSSTAKQLMWQIS